MESSAPQSGLFPLLPQEIRELIWIQTIYPRLIPLECKEYNSDPVQDGPTTYRLSTSPGTPAGLAQPVVFFPGREVRFNISKIQPVILLSVCKESRITALRQGGYRAWMIANTNGRPTRIMWSPQLDTVSFIEPHDCWLSFAYRGIFRKQFPAQTKEVQSLALPTSHGPYGHAKSVNGGIISMWLDFVSLKEVVVVIAEQYEKRNELLGVYQSGSEEGGPWIIPKDIEQGLENLKSSLLEGDWKLPEVRVVQNQESIMERQSQTRRLRFRVDRDEQEPREADQT